MSKPAMSDDLDLFYYSLSTAYSQAIDSEVPIDLLYGVVKAFEKQITVDYERFLLNNVQQEFVEYTTPGATEMH